MTTVFMSPERRALLLRIPRLDDVSQFSASDRDFLLGVAIRLTKSVVPAALRAASLSAHAAACESAADVSACAAATETASEAAWASARHASEAAGAAYCAFDYLAQGRVHDARDEIATVIEECAAAAEEEAIAAFDRMPCSADFAADFRALDLARATAREAVYARAVEICAFQ